MKRQEQKILLNSNEISKVLRKYHFFKSYNSRQINSIYFDDIDFNNFYDGEEGTVPRKKVRFRWYGNYKKINFNSPFSGKIEIKETLQNFRLKKKINAEAKNFAYLEKIIKKLFNKNLKGVCMITYLRHYYENKKLRFTYDENIKCNNLKSLGFYSIKNNIVEAKFDDSNLYNFNSVFGDKVTKFSKYSLAISKLYKV